jgi:hypothetical protein
MGILDDIAFDPATLRQASEAAAPGWLDVALPSRAVAPGSVPASSPALAGAGQSLASALASLTPASRPAAGAQAGATPFAALFGGPGGAVSPAGGPSAGGPSLGERANAAVMNFLNGHGVLPAIGGAIAGATTGQRTDPLGLMQAHQAATARALAGAGVAPDIAQAAAQDPDILRLIAQIAGALQKHGAPAPAAAALPTPAAAPSPADLGSATKTRQG